MLSAVEMLRALGDEVRPDFSHERVCVIGGGNVTMDVAHHPPFTLPGRQEGHHRLPPPRRRHDGPDEEIAGAKAEGCELFSSSTRPLPSSPKTATSPACACSARSVGGLSRGRFAPRRLMPREVIPLRAWWWPLARPSSPGPSRSRACPASAGASRWGRFRRTRHGWRLLRRRLPRVVPPRSSAPSTQAKVAAGNIDNYLGFNHWDTLDMDLPPCSSRARRAAPGAR